MTFKTGQPTISVIIPAYQHARDVVLCLEGLFQQTYTDFEIILVNDGSTDGTEEVVEPFLDRITYIYQDQVSLLFMLICF